MNSTAKLAFYNARKRDYDIVTIVDQTGYSKSHISNVLAGRRSINEMFGNTIYNISRRRMKNSERVK